MGDLTDGLRLQGWLCSRSMFRLRHQFIEINTGSNTKICWVSSDVCAMIKRKKTSGRTKDVRFPDK